MKNLVLHMALIGFVSSAAAASAQDLRPLENYSINFGDVTGSVYMTDTPAGSHMVATLSSGAYNTPVRFVTDLAANQSATVSVPRGPGQAALEVTFTRRGEHVSVTNSSTLCGIN